jgi:hypothetical protein
MASIGDHIQRLDSFAKTHDEFRTKTFIGGLVTILSTVLIGALVIYEYVDFQTVIWKPHLIVDTSRKERMTIDFDISFPKVPCFALTLDVMDSAEQYQNNLNDGITKISLGSKGKELGVYKEKDLKRPNNFCGSCHDANMTGPNGRNVCCNSCSAVFAAYEHRNLAPPVMEKIEQCVAENWSEKIEKHTNEGCRIRGSFQVNKVVGNFHFAPGHSYDAFNYHLHDVRFLDGLHLDFSHHIHYISFGKHHEQILNPLDNTKNLASAPERSFKYFAKVVAAEFRYRKGEVLHTNQFAVTQNDNETRGDKAAFPSVFFNYEISPMIVIYTQYKKPFTAFLVGICAVIGGVYTVAAIIDTIIFHAERRIRQKVQIGKTN